MPNQPKPTHKKITHKIADKFSFIKKRPILYGSLGGILAAAIITSISLMIAIDRKYPYLSNDNINFNYYDVYNEIATELDFVPIDYHNNSDDNYGYNDGDYDNYSYDDGDYDYTGYYKHAPKNKHNYRKSYHYKGQYNSKKYDNDGYFMYDLFDDVLSDYDSDEDGVLSTQERDNAKLERFASVDTDDNETIDSDELTAFLSTALSQNLKSRFILMDKDEDNVLSKKEQRRLFRRLSLFKNRSKINAMDTDNDKVLSEDEFVTYFTKESNRRSRALFVKLDRNSDDVLSLDEFGRFIDHSTK